MRREHAAKLSDCFIAFDYDYTLVDSSGCLLPALAHGFTAVRIATPAESVLRKLIGVPLRRQFEIIARDRSTEYATFETIYRHWRDQLETNGSTLIPGVLDGLQQLTERGASLAIVSTGAKRRLMRSLDRLGIREFFKLVVAGVDDKGEGIALARREVGGRRQRAFYVGDRPDDGQWATAARVAFIGVSTGAFRQEEFPPTLPVLDSISLLPDYLENGLT